MVMLTASPTVIVIIQIVMIAVMMMAVSMLAPILIDDNKTIVQVSLC